MIICPSFLDANFWINSCIPHGSTLIPKKLFLKFGLYDEKFQVVSDYEKWILFYKNNIHFKHIHTIVSKFYEGGISTDPNHQDLHKEERDYVLSSYFSKAELNMLLNPSLYRYPFSLYRFFRKCQYSFKRVLTKKLNILKP